MPWQGIGRSTLPISGGGGASSGGNVTQWTEQNTLYVGKHGLDANNGKSINLAKLTIANALAAAVSPTTIFVCPGTYSESGLALATGVYLVGMDRNTTTISSGASAMFTAAGGLTSEIRDFTLTANAGVAVMAVNAATVRMSRCSITGSVSLTGNAGVLTLYDNCSVTGRVEILGGNVATILTLDNVRVVGDATDSYALYINDADPIMYIQNDSYLKGVESGGGFPAVYWDTVTNNSLRTKHSTFIHGDETNNPFAVSAAQTPTFRSHHCSFNADPEVGGIFTNTIAVGQRFDTLDALAVY